MDSQAAVPAAGRHHASGRTDEARRGAFVGVEVKIGDELRMSMAASPAGVGLAWSLVEQRLLRWGIGADVRYDAHLVLAELMANAIAVTPPAGCVTVHCRREAAGIVLGVADPCPALPRRPAPVAELRPGDLDLRPEHFDDNGGWGLTIVTALAASWGVTPLPSGGKIVWARLGT